MLEQLHEGLLRLLLALEELTVQRGGLLRQALERDQALPRVLKRNDQAGRRQLGDDAGNGDGPRCSAPISRVRSCE